MASRIEASNLGITNGSFGASANWSVIRKETFCACSTITRIFANSIDASFVTGTFVISYTSWRIVKFNWFTTSVGVWCPAFSARANHGSEGDGVHHRTNSRDVAGIEFVAWIDTFLVDTGSSGRTVRINFALNDQIRDRLLFGCT